MSSKKSSDYLIEAHTGAWFANMIIPGTGAFLLTGPVGGAAVASTSAILAMNYSRILKNKIKDLVKANSKSYSLEKIETFN